jgi:hypothetical protein
MNHLTKIDCIFSLLKLLFNCYESMIYIYIYIYIYIFVIVDHR